MPAIIQVSEVIARPVPKVFHFYADEHVRNHPRWDPDIELWRETDGPIGIGTIIRRRNSRSGTPVEGRMEVVEYEPGRAFGLVIHDGPAVMQGRATFDAADDHATTLTISVALPGLDASADTSFLTRRLEHSARTIKQLIESET
jgi:Polyketide cyclase / dehydrase and lipid transport